MMYYVFFVCIFFFFNDTATTEIYTLSLHDALPIWWGSPRTSAGTACSRGASSRQTFAPRCCSRTARRTPSRQDRKSTRLNSSHANISYAVFCLKKKKKNDMQSNID